MFSDNNLPYVEFDSSVKNYYFLIVDYDVDMPDNPIVKENILLTYSNNKNDIIKVRNKLIKNKIFPMTNLKIQKINNLLYVE